MINPKDTVCFGISHHSTPVALRELIVCTPTALAQTMAADPLLQPAVDEWVILSTCNRFEP